MEDIIEDISEGLELESVLSEVFQRAKHLCELSGKLSYACAL